MRNLPEILVENIKRRMLMREWNQTDLANRTGINRVLINKYLSETNVPGIEAIEKIALALETSASALLDDGSSQAAPEQRLELVSLALRLESSLLAPALIALRGLAGDGTPADKPSKSTHKR